jgi:hypothetical protein
MLSSVELYLISFSYTNYDYLAKWLHKFQFIYEDSYINNKRVIKRQEVHIKAWPFHHFHKQISKDHHVCIIILPLVDKMPVDLPI